ncbi:aspartate ammonia-lyase [Aminobacter sp. MSH1]|uniref:aspartate ammonia-lyase n=1 Tax=Aminobacter sp. MSH1 TaxID=374606 RepID=UPI000D3B321F|nr:aspartate ammonia-lyase [Aminobacter sp. MSH1]
MLQSEAQSTRVERDYLGEVSIPADKLFGINSVRGAENLTVSPLTIAHYPAFVTAFAQCKLAAALANRDVAKLTAEQAAAIEQACRDLIAGKFTDSLIVDLLEGSGGTSTNMNFNEVIANRAAQIAGGAMGEYHVVHPNDHVNASQSTNDVYPSALKIATYALLAPLVDEVAALADVLDAKAAEFADVLHLGRTCLQDAQPMMLGQVFGGYAALSRRLASSLTEIRGQLLTLPLGGTAIGTGFGAPAQYREAVYRHLRTITGVEYAPPADPFDAMQNMDVFSRVSGELRTTAAALAKIASDLTILSSGPAGGLGEIRLPMVQAGSSIMPGKVNPVIPMAMIQIGFAVIGNDVSVANAVQYGQLEINHFEPIVTQRVFDSIMMLTNGVRAFRDRCIAQIEADVGANEAHVMRSMAVATALVPTLGYAQVSKLARRSVDDGRPLLELLEEQGLLDREEAAQLMRSVARPVFNRS